MTDAASLRFMRALAQAHVSCRNAPSSALDAMSIVGVSLCMVRQFPEDFFTFLMQAAAVRLSGGSSLALASSDRDTRSRLHVCHMAVRLLSPVPHLALPDDIAHQLADSYRWELCDCV